MVGEEHRVPKHSRHSEVLLKHLYHTTLLPCYRLQRSQPTDLILPKSRRMLPKMRWLCFMAYINKVNMVLRPAGVFKSVFSCTVLFTFHHKLNQVGFLFVLLIQIPCVLFFKCNRWGQGFFNCCGLQWTTLLSPPPILSGA